MIMNFERDMLWPDQPPRVANWGTFGGLVPAVWQDGMVSSHQAYVRGPAAVPAGAQAAYGLAMVPPNQVENCVYRVLADANAPAQLCYGFVEVTGSGEVSLTEAETVFLGGAPADLAVAIPPNSNTDLSLVFALIAEGQDVSYSHLGVIRLVGRPPSYACAVS